MSFAEFQRAFPSEADPRVLALVNGIADPAVPLPKGALLKRIDGPRVGDAPGAF